MTSRAGAGFATTGGSDEATSLAAGLGCAAGRLTSARTLASFVPVSGDAGPGGFVGATTGSGSRGGRMNPARGGAGGVSFSARTDRKPWSASQRRAPARTRMTRARIEVNSGSGRQERPRMAGIGSYRSRGQRRLDAAPFPDEPWESASGIRGPQLRRADQCPEPWVPGGPSSSRRSPLCRSGPVEIVVRLQGAEPVTCAPGSPRKRNPNSPSGAAQSRPDCESGVGTPEDQPSDPSYALTRRT